jgi:hypothetical protein
MVQADAIEHEKFCTFALSLIYRLHQTRYAIQCTFIVLTAFKGSDFYQNIIRKVWNLTKKQILEKSKNEIEKNNILLNIKTILNKHAMLL